MPRRCSVIGCRSNYDTETEYVTIFALPRCDSERKKWLQEIPNDLSRIKNPFVCLKHFDESFIIRTDRVTVKGKLKEYPRKIPKLKEGAFPSIFPKKQKCSTKRRRLSNVENRDECVKESCSVKEYNDRQTISSINDIIEILKRDSQIQDRWSFILNSSKLVLCLLDINSEYPVLLSSIIIQNNLTFEIFVDNVKISTRNEILSNTETVTSENILYELICFVERTVREPFLKKILILPHLCRNRKQNITITFN